jgi:hypothetical protein
MRITGFTEGTGRSRVGHVAVTAGPWFREF